MKRHLIVGTTRARLRAWMVSFAESKPPRTCFIHWDKLRVHTVDDPIDENVLRDTRPDDEYVLLDARPDDERVIGQEFQTVQFMLGVAEHLKYQYQLRIRP